MPLRVGSALTMVALYEFGEGGGEVGGAGWEVACVVNVFDATVCRN